MYRLKITCYTPKGKSESSSKNFAMKYFDTLRKPVETKLVSDSEFYYVYDYKNEKKMYKVINHKIPKAELTIRSFYILIMSLVRRANRLGKRGAWGIEKTRRWIMNRLSKRVKNPRELEDFIDAIDMKDEKEMEEFLSKDLFKWEILEVKNG